MVTPPGLARPVDPPRSADPRCTAEHVSGRPTVPGVWASTPGLAIGDLDRAEAPEGLEHRLDDLETDEGKHPMPAGTDALSEPITDAESPRGDERTEKKNFVDLVHGGRKRGHFDGLRDVGVGLRGIGANEGSVTVRGGQHHTGNRQSAGSALIRPRRSRPERRGR